MPQIYSRSSSLEPSSRSQQRRRQKRSWQRRLRYVYHRFVRMEGSPEALARGLAAGVFSGWFPWMGLQMVIAVFLAAIVRGNKIIAATATWVSNPFTYIPIFGFNYQVGRWLLGAKAEPFDLSALTTWHGITTLGSNILVELFLGSFVIGLICAQVSYVVGLQVVRSARQQRLAKRRSMRSVKRYAADSGRFN